MYHLDKNTVLNSTAKALEKQLGPVATKSQLTQNVLNQIQAGRRKLKPYRPKQICMYPHSPKRDDFNISEGLGNVSLQPVIDHLNNLKKNIIREIKTKIQAMGPENTKDIKLAGGAVEIIQEVYEAAKCFSQIVSNVNKVIDTYIQGCNLIISQVVDQINTLTTQVNTLKRMLLTESIVHELEGVISKELIAKLNSYTSIFDMLGIVNEMLNAIESIETGLNTLGSTKRKIALHAKCSLMALRSAINGLNNALSTKEILNSNIEYAKTLVMKDDYLNDFNFSPDFLESSFNWSITNHNSIPDYSTIDEFSILTKLDGSFKNYGNAQKPILIQSRSQPGYIVVPEDSDGMIALGVDESFPVNVTLTLELSINDGETIISARNTTDNKPNSDEMLKINKGQYMSNGKESFDFVRCTKKDSKTYSLILKEGKDLDDIPLGSLYNFVDPLTSETWNAIWRSSESRVINLPFIYKVVDKAPSEIVVERQDDLSPLKFFTSENYTYELGSIYDNSCYPYISSGDIPDAGIFYLKDYVLDMFTLYEEDIDRVSGAVTNDPHQYNIDNATKIVEIEVGVMKMQKYSPSATSKIPHAGDKIKCKNWALTLQVTGEQSDVNKVRFNKTFPTDEQHIIAMKAHWGFIPDSI